MKKFTFQIPCLTPSLNALVKGRMNWRDYGREQKDWFLRVKLAVQYLDIPRQEKMDKRMVEVKSYRVSLLDPDNLKGGMKMLLDAMVAAELLYDDGPAFLHFPDPEQIPVRKHKLEQTEVTLTIYE